jgi:hypothetical protein
MEDAMSSFFNTRTLRHPPPDLPPPFENLMRADREVENLRLTFEGKLCKPAVILAGSHLFRYGGNPTQASSTRREWMNVSPEFCATSATAIARCALLDFTVSDLGEYEERADSTTGRYEPIPDLIEPDRTDAQAWNVAAFVSHFQVRRDLPARIGIAGRLLLDLETGKMWHERLETPPPRHFVVRSGGAKQCLIHRIHRARLNELFSPVQLARGVAFH